MGQRFSLCGFSSPKGLFKSFLLFFSFIVLVANFLRGVFTHQLSMWLRGAAPGGTVVQLSSRLFFFYRRLCDIRRTEFFFEARTEVQFNLKVLYESDWRCFKNKLLHFL